MSSLTVTLHRLSLAVLCSFAPLLALASENGATNWPLGVNTVIPGLLPPPGATELYGYTVYYSADTLKGNDGESVPIDFDLEVFAQAFRVVHTWDIQTDAGVKFSSGAILSGGRNSLKIADFGIDEHKTGFNQLYLTPLYLTWSPTPELHLLTGFSAFIPLGDYDRNDPINTTSNYASYVQEFGLTWFPTPQWEFSVSPTLSFNAENSDTDYQSGNLFNVDYNIGYRFPAAPQWQVGLAGHYTKQFSDDQLDGHDIPGGNRLSKFAIGPQVFYSFDQATGVAFKWLHETSVKNGPKGHSLWFQFAIPL
ncbi:transporter [Pseudomonas lalucatii]|uniref:Transporter n=1 Tax=Pseudomonas lalucatii TaxID=1424203 RepID=A0ABS5PX55_9PSED|nr:transporter [Pseudomonas lalucatii]MBS7661062.1 transporter [Pseudomonas lalucatii]